MRTLLIAHNFIAKSVSAMSYSLAYNLAEKGNRVVFVSHRPYFSEMKIITVGVGEIIVTSWSSENRPVSLKDFLWFLKLYLKFKPEIIIGHFVGSNIASIVSKLASFGKVKTIVYYHTLTKAIQLDHKRSRVLQKILRLRKQLFYYLFCDIIVCPSDFGKIDLKENFSVDGIVVLNSISDRWNEIKITSDDEIVISYLGRLDHTKGVLDMIDAFDVYQKKNENSKLVLNIAGSGNLEHQVKQKIKNIKKIKYVGALLYEKVDAYLNSSHFTIIPSKFDNLPTVGIESLMNKTPLLISNSTGLTKYLTDGVECYKFEPTIDGIYDVFSKAEANIESYHKMQDRARETYLSEFTNEKYFENISKIIS